MVYAGLGALVVRRARNPIGWFLLGDGGFLAIMALSSAYAASSPHGCPRPSTPAVNARATRARSGRPATVTLPRTAAPSHQRTCPFPALPRRNPPGRRANTPADMRCEARSRANAVRYASVRPRFRELVRVTDRGHAWPRTTGVGAVMLTVRPVPCPAGSTAAAGTAWP